MSHIFKKQFEEPVHLYFYDRLSVIDPITHTHTCLRNEVHSALQIMRQGWFQDLEASTSVQFSLLCSLFLFSFWTIKTALKDAVNDIQQVFNPNFSHGSQRNLWCSPWGLLALSAPLYPLKVGMQHGSEPGQRRGACREWAGTLVGSTLSWHVWWPERDWCRIHPNTLWGAAKKKKANHKVTIAAPSAQISINCRLHLGHGTNEIQSCQGNTKLSRTSLGWQLKVQ